MAETQFDGGREAALQHWLTDHFGHAQFDLQIASADASFRRYFRVTVGGDTRIAMDAPPPAEDCRPFVAVAGLLQEAGLHAPAIYAQDLQRGFLLLEDFGDDCYLGVLDADNADRLFADAIDALIAWQCASWPDALPDYDAGTLYTELALFDQWYLGRHLGIDLTADERAQLQTMYQRIVDIAMAQPRVFVHRDYMPRNLMLTTPNPGIIDFQDARYGPISYDLLSLFKDAFVSWPQARIDGWVADYWHKARAAGLPVPDQQQFRHDLDWMGVQRHLKVLGIFARIRYRDGKPHYLEDAPRFVGYLVDSFARQVELAPLARLFEHYGLAPCKP